MLRRCAYLLSILAALVSSGHAVGGAAGQPRPPVAVSSPEGGARTHVQNYKDMVLAECVATAYRRDPEVAKDAGSSATALRDWTLYDWERHPYQQVRELVDAYLARDYANPLVEAEIKGVRFDLLKCLDLYHSRELSEHVKRVVIKPRRTYRQEHPKPSRQD